MRLQLIQLFLLCLIEASRAGIMEGTASTKEVKEIVAATGIIMWSRKGGILKIMLQGSADGGDDSKTRLVLPKKCADDCTVDLCLCKGQKGVGVRRHAKRCKCCGRIIYSSRPQHFRLHGSPHSSCTLSLARAKLSAKSCAHATSSIHAPLPPIGEKCHGIADRACIPQLPQRPSPHF